MLQGMVPVVESELIMSGSSMVFHNPVVGTLVVTLVAPFAVACFYYISCFSFLCGERWWIAYLVTALVQILPRIANVNTFWPADYQTAIYIGQLPVHMLSCWAYQKTDNVWTPIILHAVMNLIGSLVFLYIYYFVWI
jgi:hypothetical protein